MSGSRPVLLLMDFQNALVVDDPVLLGLAFDDLGDELLLAVRKVNRGESYLSPLIAKETVTFLLNKREPFTEEKRITKRQSEILQLLAEGLSMKQVASVIDVKPGTVAFHKYRMMETLNITTNAELLGYAIKHQMISS